MWLGKVKMPLWDTSCQFYPSTNSQHGKLHRGQKVIENLTYEIHEISFDFKYKCILFSLHLIVMNFLTGISTHETYLFMI